jgi:hypothetical protein
MSEPNASLSGRTIVYAGELWRILSVGADRNGSTYCHLANLARGHMQKNGWMPVQIGDWIDNAVLARAKFPKPQPTNPNQTT